MSLTRKLFTLPLFFSIILIFSAFELTGNKQADSDKPKQNPPIYIAFLWHMHQPIYWPYEFPAQIDQNGRFPFSVVDIHNQRIGPYTNWPRNAVQKGITANLPNFGAQVSFSGSLIENLNSLEQGGNGNFNNWKSHWNYIKNQLTIRGNPRLDLVAFGFHHPLMGLISYKDIRKQIAGHREILSQNFPGSYSKGIFPPENAFALRMIPALVDEGLEWVLVDNIHFDRAAQGYPFSTGGNIYEPNKADIVNPNPNDWIQLNGLWAPTKISAKWGHQPRYVQYINPESGESKKIVAVPADRYMGNEDGRGGFGALNYEYVMSQLEQFNTDPDKPILIVLHHDGDNYGGGSESYYGSNFQSFVNWLLANPSRFVCTTIEDYLEMFPPDPNDIIHIESGSWSGADNGDPEFKKWLGDPDPVSGYSPDINSWGVLTAAQNYVHHADNVAPANTNTIHAWKYLLVSEASDYWYWDGSLNGIWDSNPTRGANIAVNFAKNVTNGSQDNTPPTVFIPQREPYNPGGTEWNIQQPSDFKVWTYAYDLSGLKSVKLFYREDADGFNDPNTMVNETYAGGAGVGSWIEINMTGTLKPSLTNPQPVVKAKEYVAQINGLNNVLLDYYVEAIDSFNNVYKTQMQHVWVGQYTPGGGGGGGQSVFWTPNNVTQNDTIIITVKNVTQGAKLHWGVNYQGSTWQTPNQVYWPEGTVPFSSGNAVESPFSGPGVDSTLTIKIGPFNNAAQVVSKIAFVIHFDDNTWNNNNGQDFKIDFGTGGGGGGSFVLNGTLDESAVKVATNQNADLFLGWNGSELYVASQSAQTQSNDVFIIVTDSLKALKPAMWGKAGQVTGWKLFLGNESTNNWSGWFDHSSNPGQAAGQILEGVINVQNEFGYIPSKIYIAVGQYQTNDNGTLVKQIPGGNGDGNIDPSEFFEFNYLLTSVKYEESKIEGLPTGYSLSQNFPNPFLAGSSRESSNTIIRYEIPEEGLVTIQIYDVLGNKITELVNDYKMAGFYELKYDPSNLSSGIYFYTISVNNFRDTKKMIIAK